MISRKLVATVAVVTASALAPAAVAAATPSPDRAAFAPGTQVGSEGVHAKPPADGIIAILIGLR